MRPGVPFLPVSYELNLFQTSVDEAGLVREDMRANSERTSPGMSHQEEAKAQQPAHGNESIRSQFKSQVLDSGVIELTTGLFPVRETSVCSGGAPGPQCCCDEQLWGLYRWGGGRIDSPGWWTGRSLLIADTKKDSFSVRQCWCVSDLTWYAQVSTIPFTFFFSVYLSHLCSHLVEKTWELGFRWSSTVFNNGLFIFFWLF